MPSWLKVQPIINGQVIAPTHYANQAHYVHHTLYERQCNYQALFRGYIDQAKLKQIRAAIQSGNIFGNERFKEQVKDLENHARAEKRKAR